MSTTAIIWLGLFVFLILKGLNRPIWHCCAYIQTFFAAPAFWWWGKGLVSLTASWNLVAAIILLISLGANVANRRPKANDGWAQTCFYALAFCLANAAAVHFALASWPEHSWIFLDLMAKQTIICIVIYYAVQTTQDLRHFLMAIMLGCCFVGFQVVYAGQGHMEKGRLEGVFIPGGSDANGLSGALSMGLPIAGYFLLQGKSVYLKIVAIASAVLILETILRCNSRGAYLGCLSSGGWLFLSTSGKARLRALIIGLLGIVAFLLMAKNEAIWDRLMTVSARAEERDNSAQERIEYWKASLKMISNYPLGSGGEAAFMSPLGKTYISHLRKDEFRAVHNGYLDITASWGVQGLLLFLVPIVLSFVRSRISKRDAMQTENSEIVLLIGTIQSMLIGQATVAMFISTLDNEWFYWTIALMLLACNVDSAEEAENCYNQADESHATP